MKQNKFILTIAAAFLSQSAKAVSVDSGNDDLDQNAIWLGQLEQQQAIPLAQCEEYAYNNYIFLKTCHTMNDLIEDQINCDWRVARLYHEALESCCEDKAKADKEAGALNDEQYDEALK